MADAVVSLQFAAGDNLGAELIEWFTQGSFSHVDAVLPDGRLLGARLDGGVQIRAPGYASFSKTARVDLSVTPWQQARFHDFLYAQIGKPYDKTAILAFVAGRNWREDDSWFCSELVMAGLVEAGFFPHALCVSSNKITPDAAALVLSAFAPLGYTGGIVNGH